MEYGAGVKAFALWTGSEWVLKPICSADGVAAGANGVAVRVGDGWVVTPMVLFEPNEHAFAVRAGGGDDVLWPVRCPGAAGCTGAHPYCSVCPCDAPLAETYTVSLSGFPSICGAQYFNGTHTLTRDSDCAWACNVDATRRVRLSILSGWSVTWQDTAPGGPSGDFLATGGTSCRPETGTGSPNACFEPFGCWGLVTQYASSAACVITV